MWRWWRVSRLQQRALEQAREGHDREAVATLQEAIEIAAGMWFGLGPRTQADLLQTRAFVLYEAGRHVEAVDEAAASARLRRSLGAMDSDQLSRLADAIEVQANACTRLRRLEDADALSAEVVRLRASLPWRDRARALLNRSAMLLEAGRYEEGLESARELVRIASTHRGRDLSEPALLEVLSNLAVLLRFNGHWNEAVQVQGIAVEQLRGLGDTGAEASADLAVALANQSLLHLERGRPEEAEAPGLEALQIRERLARRSPARRSDLSDSLNNQAAVLIRLGRSDEAVVLAERCVALRRVLQHEQPDAFAVKLANALATHGHALATSGRPELGLVATREAVDRFRAIAGSDPVTTAPWLASAPDSLAEAAAQAGYEAECLAASREALSVGGAVLAERKQAFGLTHAEHLLLAAQRCRHVAGVEPG